jgi:hypothetical protein
MELQAEAEAMIALVSTAVGADVNIDDAFVGTECDGQAGESEVRIGSGAIYAERRAFLSRVYHTMGGCGIPCACL